MSKRSFIQVSCKTPFRPTSALLPQGLGPALNCLCILLFFAASSILADIPAFDPASGFPVRYKSAPSSPTKQVYFDLDLLVWDAREDGLEYAYKNTQTQTNLELTSFEPPTKFDPGFRIGFGRFLSYDSWTLGALYTYYHTQRYSSGNFQFNPTETPGPGMIAVWTYPSAFSNNNNGARFTNAKNEWKLHSSFLDLCLSRECAIASNFTASPIFGIRSAWIHQRYEVEYGAGNLVIFGAGNHVTILSSGIDMHSDSNNLGLLFGCEAKWRIGQNWDFFGDLSGAFLASYFSVGREETDLFQNLVGTLQTQSVRLHSAYWSFRPQGQIALGFRFFNTFRYGVHFARYHLSAAYEAQMWWKQNQLLRYIDKQNSSSSGANVAPTQGDLMFHGVNLEAGFDF